MKLHILTVLLILVLTGPALGQYPVGDNESGGNSYQRQTGEMPMQSVGPGSDRYNTGRNNSDRGSNRYDSSSNAAANSPTAENRIASRSTTKLSSTATSLQAASLPTMADKSGRNTISAPIRPG